MLMDKAAELTALFHAKGLPTEAPDDFFKTWVFELYGNGAPPSLVQTQAIVHASRLEWQAMHSNQGQLRSGKRRKKQYASMVKTQPQMIILRMIQSGTLTQWRRALAIFMQQARR